MKYKIRMIQFIKRNSLKETTKIRSTDHRLLFVEYDALN